MSGLWFALQFQIRVAIDAAFLCAAVALPEDESDLEVEPCLQSVESRSNLRHACVGWRAPKARS